MSSPFEGAIRSLPSPPKRIPPPDHFVAVGTNLEYLVQPGVPVTNSVKPVTNEGTVSGQVVIKIGPLTATVFIVDRRTVVTGFAPAEIVTTVATAFGPIPTPLKRLPTAML